jgi:hypothetical protein
LLLSENIYFFRILTVFKCSSAFLISNSTLWSGNALRTRFRSLLHATLLNSDFLSVVFAKKRRSEWSLKHYLTIKVLFRSLRLMITENLSIQNYRSIILIIFLRRLRFVGISSEIPAYIGFCKFIFEIVTGMIKSLRQSLRNGHNASRTLSRLTFYL